MPKKPNLTSMYQSYKWNMKKFRETNHKKYKQTAERWYQMYKKFGGKQKR